MRADIRRNPRRGVRSWRSSGRPADGFVDGRQVRFAWSCWRPHRGFRAPTIPRLVRGRATVKLCRPPLSLRFLPERLQPTGCLVDASSWVAEDPMRRGAPPMDAAGPESFTQLLNRMVSGDPAAGSQL